MDINRAREVIRSLAEGVDPATGEVLSGENVYNHPVVIRALFTMLEATTPNPLDPLRNAGKPWTKVEEDALRDEFAGNMKIRDIAREHGRTYRAIESRLEQLGLKKKPFRLFKRK